MYGKDAKDMVYIKAFIVGGLICGPYQITSRTDYGVVGLSWYCCRSFWHIQTSGGFCRSGSNGAFKWIWLCPLGRGTKCY